MDCSISFKGFDEFADKLRHAPDEVRAIKQRMLFEMSNKLREKAAELAPKDTRHLAQSIQARTNNEIGGDVTGRVSTSLTYARAQEEGAKPHVIVAINKKALASKKLGIIFGKVVNHPGNKPQPFMQPAKEFIESHFEEFKKIGYTLIDRLKF